MKHAVSFLTTALSITFFASTVFAQTMPPSEYDYSGEPNHYSSPANTPVGVISPSRPLITTDGGISDYGGFVFDFSKDADLKVATPMGVSFGVLPGLEFGVDIALLLKPFWTDVLFASVRLYGRYLLLEDLLAVELALYPALQGRLGVEVLTPVRVEIDKLLIFGQAKLQLWPDGQIESGNHYRAISSAAVLYEVADKIHALVNLGFSFESIGIQTITMNPDFTTTTTNDRTSNLVLPIGFGGAYALTPDLFVSAAISLDNLNNKDPITDDAIPFDRRSFAISLVQAVNLQGDMAAPDYDPHQAEGATDAPLYEEITDPTAEKISEDEGWR